MINISHKKLDKNTLCKLVNASIEEEIGAANEYAEILALIPKDDEFEECADVIKEIMEDESKHAFDLIKTGKTLGCKAPDLKEEDKKILDIVNHVHKIEIK